MPTLLQRAASWLADKLQDAAGRSCVYSRAGDNSDPLIAFVTFQEYEVPDEQEPGIPQKVTFIDWTFRGSDLALVGSPIEPRAGDRITETLGADTIVYEALPPGNKPVAEWADTSGTLIVVHTKRVA